MSGIANPSQKPEQQHWRVCVPHQRRRACLPRCTVNPLPLILLTRLPRCTANRSALAGIGAMHKA